jgi:putative nucleotidyltransferase with HDIG domain
MNRLGRLSKDKVKKLLKEVGKGEESLVETLFLLVRTLEERDSYTFGHSERVAELAVAIGKKLRFGKTRLERLRRGALLHDIGKIGIPDRLLYKPGHFTLEERARMNQHPEKGHFIVINSHLLWDLIPMIRNHHENFDGSGYPDGLKGRQIPVEARIVSLSDYFDALVTKRPYKEAFPKGRSIHYVKSMAGKKFDPQVVKAFLKVANSHYNHYIRPLQHPIRKALPSR